MSEKKAPICYCDFIKDVSYEKFVEIYAAAPRQARAIIMKRCGVKKNTKGSIAGMAARREKSVQDVYDAMMAHHDHQLAEQLLQNWLMTKRPMLKAALDYLNIPNDNGMTENDLDVFETMAEADCKKFQDTLLKDFDAADVYLYLKFMKLPFVAAAN